MKKAILATDLSKTAEVLLQCTGQYKALGIEHITLFHALGISYMNFSGYTFDEYEDRMLIKKNFEKINEKLSPTKKAIAGEVVKSRSAHLIGIWADR